MTLPKISHSQIVAWRQCEQRWMYRYQQKLVPKRLERPLHMGNWVHSCLEAHYGGGDWKVAHASYVKQYDKLFDEEKLALDKGNSKRKSEDREDYEPLPRQVERIMASYLWYNRNEKIKVLGVEKLFELQITGDDGLEYILVGVLDLIYEDTDGLIWIRDHKVWDEIPDEGAFHTMDPQLTIYLHGAKEALGVEAAGIEYSYVRSAAPTVPTLRKKDGQLSEAAISTDYPTVFRFLRENNLEPRDYRGVLEPLAASSPFLRRYRLPRSEVVTAQILADASQTAAEIINHDHTVRNITRQCSWCPYQQLCRGELFGLNMDYLKKDRYMIEDKRPVRVVT
jgi:hypothetical protein